jgi:hypothetical protein
MIALSSAVGDSVRQGHCTAVVTGRNSHDNPREEALDDRLGRAARPVMLDLLAVQATVSMMSAPNGKSRDLAATLRQVCDNLVRERDRLRDARRSVSSQLGPLPAASAIDLGLFGSLGSVLKEGCDGHLFHRCGASSSSLASRD